MVVRHDWAGRPCCRFVVTRLGQVAHCPSDDPTGEETMRALIERATTRIPVAQLTP
jgi:hypothetical protein